MQLRPYQSEAVAAVYDHLRSRDDNPCVVIPTAGGKTPVLATICADVVDRWDGRVVVLAHVKELLAQAVEKLRIIAPALPVGVYSAGLGSKDLGYAVTVAGVQSIYKRARSLGRVDIVIVDEAHLIPPDGEGMYRRFIDDARAANPLVRVIGLTATPYRMKSGSICDESNILNHVCYEVGVRELIAQGYICDLRSRAGVVRSDFSRLRVRAGEFVASEVEEIVDSEVLVQCACREIIEQTVNRKSVLIFAASVQHGRHVAEVIKSHGAECGFVCGDTPAIERAETLDRFVSGDLKYLANVNVLTTGFDAPPIDCVALLRPTLSPGLYYQMVGRGFRLSPGKTDCLVLDFGGNVIRHGPVDAICVDAKSRGDGEAPAKECPECHALIHAGYQTCPECGYEFPQPQKQPHEATASSDGVLTGQTSREVCEVDGVDWFVHEKKNKPSAPHTMRVEYEIAFQTYAKEWICFDHQGYARRKAEAWWRARSDEPVPRTVEEAVNRAQYGALAPTKVITIERTAGDFDRIVEYELGAKPVPLEADEWPEENTGADTVATVDGWEVPF